MDYTIKQKKTSNSYDILSEEFNKKTVLSVKCGLEGGYVQPWLS